LNPILALSLFLIIFENDNNFWIDIMELQNGTLFKG